jgi:DNA mismatch endonuclease (patch repair protein)
MRKGQKMSEEQRLRQTGKGNPMFGRTGKKHPVFGRKAGKEELKKRSDIKKGSLNPMFGRRGTLSPFFGKKHSKKTRRKQSEFHVSHPNKIFKDTKIELIIESELKRRGFVYEKQVPLCKIARVDFYLPEYRVVIQCDGCYWHNCPIHGKGEINNCTQRAKDQDSVLTFNGFNVYHFWECEINKSVEECINRIKII